MQRFLILQSGFITPEVTGLILPAEKKPDLSRVIIKPNRHVNTEFYFAQELDTLYTTYTSNDIRSHSFEFTERYLKEIIRLINGVSFYDWVTRQLESPKINDTNVQFLLDTLNFIAGTGRSIDVISWAGLVEASTGAVNRRHLGDLLKCYFGMQSNTLIYNGPIIPTDLSKVLSLWLSRPNGFKDLFVTMGVIFGDHRRPDIISANENAEGRATFVTNRAAG